MNKVHIDNNEPSGRQWITWQQHISINVTKCSESSTKAAFIADINVDSLILWVFLFFTPLPNGASPLCSAVYGEKTLTDQVKWNSRYVTEIKRQDRKLVRRRVVFPTEQDVFIRGIQLRQSVVSLWSQTLSCLLVSLCYCNRQSVSGKKKVGYSKESINIPQNIFSITKWLLNSLFYSLFSWSCQSYKPNNWICKVFSTALQGLPCTEY